MKNSFCFTILVFLLLILTAGCSNQPPRVSAFYGTAYELALQSQINNPNAGVHTGPPTGLVDGVVAVNVVERYEKGYETPAAKTESYSIDVSGMSKK